MPKNSPEVILKPLFSEKMRHFLPFLEASCVQRPASFFINQLQFAGYDPRFLTYFKGQMHWVRKSQLFKTKVKSQKTDAESPEMQSLGSFPQF